VSARTWHSLPIHPSTLHPPSAAFPQIFDKPTFFPRWSRVQWYRTGYECVSILAHNFFLLMSTIKRSIGKLLVFWSALCLPSVTKPELIEKTMCGCKHRFLISLKHLPLKKKIVSVTRRLAGHEIDCYVQNIHLIRRSGSTALCCVEMETGWSAHFYYLGQQYCWQWRWTGTSIIRRPIVFWSRPAGKF